MDDKAKAQDLAEQALETALDGDERKARELADKANAIDPSAAAQVAEEAAAEGESAQGYEPAAGGADEDKLDEDELDEEADELDEDVDAAKG